MTEQLYTLTEARRQIAAEVCDRTGHRPLIGLGPWQHYETGDLVSMPPPDGWTNPPRQPATVVCERCGKVWDLVERPDDSGV